MALQLVEINSSTVELALQPIERKSPSVESDSATVERALQSVEIDSSTLERALQPVERKSPSVESDSATVKQALQVVDNGSHFLSEQNNGKTTSGRKLFSIIRSA